MERSLSFANNTSSAGSAVREAERVVKGESAPGEEPETARKNSESFSPTISLPVGRDDSREKHKPVLQRPPKDLEAFKTFRSLCDGIFNELERIDAFFIGDVVSDNGSEVVAEIEVLLEDLYGCEYGQGESLKRTVVGIQSQVNNARWARNHVEFLRDVMRFLRVRYLVDEATVTACYEMMKARGLDPFRGTICEPSVVKRYRVEENDKPGRAIP